MSENGQANTAAMIGESVTTSRGLIRNTAFNVGADVLRAVVAICMVPFLIRSLGDRGYGIWILIGSVFSYAMMLEMGLSSAINRYIPVYVAQSDEEGVKRTVSTATFFFLLLGILLVGVTAVLYRYVDVWFSRSIPDDLADSARRLVLVVGLCFACMMPMQPYMAIISGLQRYDIHSLSRTIPLVLRTVAVVILLLRGYGLVTVGLVYGLAEVATRMLPAVFTKALLKGRLLSVAAVDLQLLKDMLLYGLNTFLYVMGAVIVYKASDVIIGIFLTSEAITQFSVSVSALLMLSALLQAFNAAIKPAVSDLDARSDKRRIREVAFLSQKYSLLLLIPACAFLVIMGRELLVVWIGKEYGRLHPVLIILTVGHFLRLANHSSFLVLVGKGDHRLFGVLTIAMAGLCVTLAIIAVGVLKTGLLGIAIANLIPMSLTCGLVLPWYFNRKMQIPVAESILRVWWPAIRGSLPAVLALAVWGSLCPPESWIGILAVVGVIGALALGGGWLFSMEPLERKRVMLVLGNRSLSGRPNI